jgi:GNAT superfamily N-acetyltransferase
VAASSCRGLDCHVIRRPGPTPERSPILAGPGRSGSYSVPSPPRGENGVPDKTAKQQVHESEDHGPNLLQEGTPIVRTSWLATIGSFCALQVSTPYRRRGVGTLLMKAWRTAQAPTSCSPRPTSRTCHGGRTAPRPGRDLDDSVGRTAEASTRLLPVKRRRPPARVHAQDGFRRQARRDLGRPPRVRLEPHVHSFSRVARTTAVAASTLIYRVRTAYASSMKSVPSGWPRKSTNKSSSVKVGPRYGSSGQIRRRPAGLSMR